MSMTDEEFGNFLQHCYDRLVEKQERLHHDFQIGQYEEYWYDQERSVLQFKNNGQVMLEFSVVFIGSWSGNSNTWMWAWANESMTEEVRKQSLALQKLKDITGFDIFVNHIFECDEMMAHELTALAVECLEARGMYISPNEKIRLFMAIMEPMPLMRRD